MAKKTKLKGGLDTRLARSLFKGGDSGPALVAGKHAESLLYERVAAGEMPPGKKKLAPREVELLARWIDAGAENGTRRTRNAGGRRHVHRRRTARTGRSSRSAGRRFRASSMPSSCARRSIAFLLSRLQVAAISRTAPRPIAPRSSAGSPSI